MDPDLHTQPGQGQLDPTNGANTVEWAEYTMLQEKIDKIGEFRFRVKGWAVTLVAALLVTGLSTDVPGYVLLLPIFLVLGFQLLERHEIIWQRAFGKRLYEIERYLRSKSPTWPRPAITAVVAEAASRHRNAGIRGRIPLHASGLFYLIMYFIVSAGVIWKTFGSEPQSRLQRVEVAQPLEVKMSPSDAVNEPEPGAQR